MKTTTKVFGGFTALVVLALAGFIFFRFFFVFGEGVKAGELNQMVYKGWIWKTYEGRLIQTGFKGAKDGNGIQSNEFNFSVADKTVAEKLMTAGGKNVELRYKEYRGKLPWRGMQRHIVYEIISIRQAGTDSQIPLDAASAAQ